MMQQVATLLPNFATGNAQAGEKDVLSTGEGAKGVFEQALLEQGRDAAKDPSRAYQPSSSDAGPIEGKEAVQEQSKEMADKQSLKTKGEAPLADNSSDEQPADPNAEAAAPGVNNSADKAFALSEANEQGQRSLSPARLLSETPLMDPQSIIPAGAPALETLDEGVQTEDAQIEGGRERATPTPALALHQARSERESLPFPLTAAHKNNDTQVGSQQVIGGEAAAAQPLPDTTVLSSVLAQLNLNRQISDDKQGLEGAGRITNAIKPEGGGNDLLNYLPQAVMTGASLPGGDRLIAQGAAKPDIKAALEQILIEPEATAVEPSQVKRGVENRQLISATDKAAVLNTIEALYEKGQQKQAEAASLNEPGNKLQYLTGTTGQTVSSPTQPQATVTKVDVNAQGVIGLLQVIDNGEFAAKDAKAPHQALQALVSLMNNALPPADQARLEKASRTALSDARGRMGIETPAHQAVMPGNAEVRIKTQAPEELQTQLVHQVRPLLVALMGGAQHHNGDSAKTGGSQDRLNTSGKGVQLISEAGLSVATQQVTQKLMALEHANESPGAISRQEVAQAFIQGLEQLSRHSTSQPDPRAVEPLLASSGLFSNAEVNAASPQGLGVQHIEDTHRLKTSQQGPLPLQQERPVNPQKPEGLIQLTERINMLMAQRQMTADIRLDPQDLGSMQIRIVIQGDQASVNFTVQSQQARDVLEQAAPRLREMLAERGLELGQSSVRKDGGSDASEQQHSSASNDQGVDEDEVTEPGAPKVGNRGQHNGVIDYFA